MGCTGFQKCGHTGVAQSRLVVVERSLLLTLHFNEIFFIGNLFDEGLNLNCGERRHDVGNSGGVVYAEDGRRAGGKVNVTSLVLDHGLEEEFDADVFDAEIFAEAPPDFGEFYMCAEGINALSRFAGGFFVLGGRGDGVRFFSFAEGAVVLGVGDTGVNVIGGEMLLVKMDDEVGEWAFEIVPMCSKIDSPGTPLYFAWQALCTDNLLFQEFGNSTDRCLMTCT